ncbi:MAG: ABC-type transport system, ATP-binding component [Cyanobacteria bacterium RYN_339]|nr:ABC-type transport system, ATP-binding component [Cyanobacteria bacterium RYN_339]
MILDVQGLTKRFGDFTAVDNITFHAKPGEILGLLGPNGAGKTTTIQMLLALITPTAGQIRIFGEDLARKREAILQRVNFSSTYVQLPFSLTVRENLTVFARLYGMKRQRVVEVMDELEIAHLADRKTKTLSSGQLTRLHLAKALLNHPELLFLDEPTASLDPDTADRVRKHLRAVRERMGLTMLYTSHNMREMEELCDRLVFLHQGKILFEGAPKQLLAERGVEDLEALFLEVAREEREDA